MRGFWWLLLLTTSCSVSETAARAPPIAVAPKAASASSATRRTAEPARAKAPVLVVVIVDQLASWVFEQRRPSLSPDGAFSRLLREGVYARQLRYEHATTSTAPGHAAL